MTFIHSFMAKLEKKYKILIIIGFALVIAAGAAFAIYDALPQKDIPSKRKMARILADMYVVDAIVQDYNPKGKNDRTLEQAYHSVLQHHGLTKAQYDSALLYYSKNPQEYSIVYDRAISILSSKEADLSTFALRLDSLEGALKLANDTITTNLGSWPSMIKLPLPKTDTSKNKTGKAKETAQKIDEKQKALNDSIKLHLKPSATDYESVEYEVNIDSIIGGHITFRQKYTILGGEGKMSVTVCYADSSETTDSLVFDIAKRHAQKNGEIIVQLNDTIPTTKAIIRPAVIKDRKKINLTLKDLTLFHKPYDVIDTTDYASQFPPMLSY